MSAHDPCCPLDDMPTADCAICSAIGQARGQEKETFGRVWRDNIGPISTRYYLDGYRDATDGKPIAGWVS